MNALAPAPGGSIAEGTRTLLFADLRDYTAFVERHGDLVAANLVAAYRTLIRQRVREKNVERGIAATIGYISTLAAWLGGPYVGQETDVSLVLHWLAEVGPEYLESKQRDFVQEVRKKQKRYGNTQGDDSEAAS